jgi:hypothetical protein
VPAGGSADRGGDEAAGEHAGQPLEGDLRGVAAVVIGDRDDHLVGEEFGERVGQGRGGLVGIRGSDVGAERGLFAGVVEQRPQ